MADIVVTDVDGTISDGGDPIAGVIAHLRRKADAGYPVYVVTARSGDRRASTIAWLESNDVPHSRVILNDNGGDATAYKVGVAQRLLRNNTIAEWIENNPETRAALREAGVNAVSPSEFRSHAGGKVETRNVAVQDFEVRETTDGMSFSGYASVFDSPSEDLGFTEYVRPGAFAKTLRSKNNVMLLWSHDTSQPLASTRSKTLTLAEDSKGLIVDAQLPNTTIGRDAAELVRSKVVDSMSFGFSVPRNGDTWSTDGRTRDLVEVRLHEVSLVAFPAYRATSAQVRSVDALADRTGEDADVLSSALDALVSGRDLSEDEAGLLAAVVAKLAPVAEPEPVVEPAAAPSRLELLKKQLDLAYHGI